MATRSDADTTTSNWLFPLLVLIVGMFMSLLDMSIVNVANSAIQKDFAATTDEIQWVTTAYALSLGVTVTMAGWLGERYGWARVYNISLLAFSITSALCGIAWDIESLVAFRILQAAPGSILTVVTMTIVYRMVPKEKIGTAMGIYGLGIVFAPAIGPTLGGYLVEYHDWRLVFLINLPLGLVGLALSMFLLPRFPPGRRDRFDVWGFVTSGAGLFALLLALSEGQDWGWTSYPVMLLVVFGLLSLALFVVIEREVEHPLIPMDMFKYRQLNISLVLLIAPSVGFFAVLFFVPLYVQEGMGITAFRTGLMMLPEALVMAFLMPVAGQLYDAIGPRWPSVIGLALTGWGTYLLCGINPDVPLSDIVLWTSIRAIGNALALTAITTGALAAVPTDWVDEASAVVNLVQRVGSALGLAVLTAMTLGTQAQLAADRSALLSTGSVTGRPELEMMTDQGLVGMYPILGRMQLSVTATAYGEVFFVLAIATGLSAVLAFWLTGADPAEQPAPEQPDDEPTAAAHPIPRPRAEIDPAAHEREPTTVTH